GGWGHVQERLLNSLEIAGKSTSYFSLGGDGPAGVLGYIFLLVPSFLVSPGLLQKIYGARGPSVVRLAVLLNALGLLLFAIMPPLMGMVARSSYPDLRNRELALPTVMVNLLPHWLGTLTLAAIFSAEISAADAVLSMLTTSLALSKP
ncbi:MAG: sodium:solute symporter, partial [Acidobacteria bacterium]